MVRRARSSPCFSRQSKLIKVRAFRDRWNPDPLTGKPSLVSLQPRTSPPSAACRIGISRYQLTAVPNVAEVAPIGGFVKEYQVILKPERLLAYNLPISTVMTAIQRSNNDVGGSVVEMSENEYMVRSRGYLKGLKDLGDVPVGVGKDGTPILLSELATLQIAGEERRGVGEWNGQGEAVGGVIIARFGANAYQVIHDAKAKLAEASEDGLPPGVEIKTRLRPFPISSNDPSHTLRHTLIEEMIVVALVLHGFPSPWPQAATLVAIFVIPSSMLISLFIMNLLGINANIMSLGGIAIAVGVVIDSAIIMIENAHKHLNHEEERLHSMGDRAIPRPRAEIILEAAKEVGPSLFFSLLIITVSFLPVFVLGGESGRLFKPLAFTKTFAMASAAVLSITIIPVLMVYFISDRALPKRLGKSANFFIIASAIIVPAIAIYLAFTDEVLQAPTASSASWRSAGRSLRGHAALIPQKIIHEEKSPISYILQKTYNPFFRLAIKYRWAVLVFAVAFMASAIWPFKQLGSEFMPPLDEGDLLHAHDRSQHQRHHRAPNHPADRQAHQNLPRSRQRPWENRPRRHRHRSRAPST